MKSRIYKIFREKSPSQNLTINLLSTVFTTISSGVYWLTSNLSFNTLLSPSSWINGELMSETCDCGARERLLLLLDVVELKNHENLKIILMFLTFSWISYRQRWMHESITERKTVARFRYLMDISWVCFFSHVYLCLFIGEARGGVSVISRKEIIAIIFFVWIMHGNLCVTSLVHWKNSFPMSHWIFFAFLHAEYIKMNFSRENRNENGRRNFDEHKK